MTIHTVKMALEGLHKRIVLKPDLGTKNHYRVPTYCKNKSETVIDNGLSPYLGELEYSVELVKSRVGL